MIPSLKVGVRIDLVKPQIALAFAVIQAIYAHFGEDECVITSGNDGSGVHMVGSKHFEGYAIDLRLPKQGAKWSIIHKTMKDALGKEFDVLFEKNHYHVEYDPK